MMDDHLEMLMNPRKLSEDPPGTDDVHLIGADDADGSSDDEPSSTESDSRDGDADGADGAESDNAAGEASDEGGDEPDDGRARSPDQETAAPRETPRRALHLGRPAVAMSREEVNNAKRELLYRFDRLEKKGVRLPRRFSMASDLAEMQSDYERMVKDRDADSGIRFQKQVLVALVSGVEYLNKRFDPFDFHLDGWGETVSENITDYDDVLEELHAKYRGKAKMAPELKLLMMIVGSAFMFHMTNTMFKNVPALGQVVKDNPELMKQFAAATANTMQKSGADKTGLAGMLGGLFGGPSPAPPETAPHPSMRGPSSGRIAEVQRFMSRQATQAPSGGVPNAAVRPPLPVNGREFRQVGQARAPEAKPSDASIGTLDPRGDPHHEEDPDLVDIMSAASSDATVGGTRRKKRVVLEL